MAYLKHWNGCAVACVLCLVTLCVGCESSPDSYGNENANEAAATYSGPAYLRGTIGSYGSFVNNQPRYVGGYGMVVDLNATGSNEVPGFLREWLANEMLRNRLGSSQFGTERFSPERVMADLGSSVVVVEGLIPPGAKRGTNFDVLVTMIDQTSTSLAGGRLFWPTQLAPAGLDRRLIYTQTQGTGYGELFVNPVAPAGDKSGEFQRTAVVVNGGTVLESQTVVFKLNQPSYRIAKLIEDRVNARFEATDDDNLPAAVAKNDRLIEFNVPARFERSPEELLALIDHLYLDPSPAFVRPQAEALAQSLIASPTERARAVTLAWKGLGPNVTPVLRNYYGHEAMAVRMAALEAGAWLNDPSAVAPLAGLAKTGSALERVRAARSLVAMSRNNTARKHVRAMLNDPDPEVRLGAYEALSLVRDRSIQRLSVNDGKVHKFFIDRVPSDHPAVVAIQGDELVIVIFGGDIPLRKKMFAKIDDAITLRTLPVSSIPVGLSGRYEGDSALIPVHRCGAVKLIPSLTPVSKDESDAKPIPPDWAVEVGDADGNTMRINIRDPKLQDGFGVELLNKPDRGTATEQPRFIAMVRIVKSVGKDAAGKPTPAEGELIAIRSPETPLPVGLRYRPPNGEETRVYRINPTVATLAYTLGYKADDINTQTGPDLSFSRVVSALHTLSKLKQISAPFDARINPLAQRISEAQRDNIGEPRPEITPEELEKLREQAGETGVADTESPAPGVPPTTPSAD